MKPIGRVAGFTLFGLWLSAIVTIAIFSAKEVAEYARDGEFTERIETNVVSGDTLRIAMVNNETYSNDDYWHNDLEVIYDDNGEKQLFSQDVRFLVKSTTDAEGYIKVEKHARGRTYQLARELAEEIKYDLNITNGVLNLNNYFLIESGSKYRDLSVKVTLYVPEGTIIYADKSVKRYRRWSYSNDILKHRYIGHYLKVIYNDVDCLDCEEEQRTESRETSSRNEEEQTPETQSESGVIDETESTITTVDSTGINNQIKDN